MKNHHKRDDHPLHAGRIDKHQRPDRVELRVNKRRPKVLALMTKPRREYHAELGAAS